MIPFLTRIKTYTVIGGFCVLVNLSAILFFSTKNSFINAKDYAIYVLLECVNYNYNCGKTYDISGIFGSKKGYYKPLDYTHDGPLVTSTMLTRRNVSQWQVDTRVYPNHRCQNRAPEKMVETEQYYLHPSTAKCILSNCKNVF